MIFLVIDPISLVTWRVSYRKVKCYSQLSQVFLTFFRSCPTLPQFSDIEIEAFLYLPKHHVYYVVIR